MAGCRFFISGAAALNREIAEWFHAAGILILEGYGMTETSAGSSVNHPEQYKFGTVGLPFPGTEVKIAEDGEILIKGPGMMDGYHNNPEATAETLTDDGWLRTGDNGALDSDGLLRITDRMKDLFKTSGGKYIAPPAIEAQVQGDLPLRQPVHGASATSATTASHWSPSTPTAAGWAEQNGMAGASYSDVVKSDAMKEMIAGYVDQLNSALNRWETIKKYEILDHDLTIESGELTPSLKVKRKVVEDNNKDLIDSLYA